MTDRPIQASPKVVSPPPARPAAEAPRVAGPAAPAARDGLTLGATQPAIEADVQLAMRGKPLVDADGAVRVQRAFLLRFVKDILRDPRAFSRVDVRFDAATKRWLDS